MCYSAESSIRSSLVSFIAIVVLLSSGIPHFKWLAVALIGWCSMQFVEFLLWLTEPSKDATDGCSHWNNLITTTLVPFVLIFQPLAPLFGSLYAIPWNKSTNFRKYFMVIFSVMIVMSILYFYDDPNHCTTVSNEGYLYWSSNKIDKNSPMESIVIYLWAILIILPFLLFWDKNFFIIAIFVLIPFIGLLYERYYTDAKGSIWCYYTSYSSIIGIFLLFLHKVEKITMV
jgi:hypothetical protein